MNIYINLECHGHEPGFRDDFIAPDMVNAFTSKAEALADLRASMLAMQKAGDLSSDARLATPTADTDLDLETLSCEHVVAVVLDNDCAYRVCLRIKLKTKGS